MQHALQVEARISLAGEAHSPKCAAETDALSNLATVRSGLITAIAAGSAGRLSRFRNEAVRVGAALPTLYGILAEMETARGEPRADD